MTFFNPTMILDCAMEAIVASIQTVRLAAAGQIDVITTQIVKTRKFSHGFGGSLSGHVSAAYFAQ